MDLIPYVSNYGPEGIAAFCVLAVLTGLLVPYRLLRDKQRESDEWRQAWELSEQARREERRQTEQMLDGLKLVTYIVRGIRTAVGSPGTEDEGEDGP